MHDTPGMANLPLGRDKVLGSDKLYVGYQNVSKDYFKGFGWVGALKQS